MVWVEECPTCTWCGLKSLLCAHDLSLSVSYVYVVCVEESLTYTWSMLKSLRCSHRPGSKSVLNVHGLG